MSIQTKCCLVLLVLAFGSLLVRALSSNQRQHNNSNDAECSRISSEVDLALDLGHARPLSVTGNTPWEILHGALGLGVESQLSDEHGGKINFLDYFRRGGPYFSESIYVTSGHEILMRRSRTLAEIERHPNQFLAYFAQMELPLETRIQADGKSFTIRDMVATAKRRFDPLDEATFTLLAFAAYVPIGDKWENQHHQLFGLADIVALELKADPDSLACGGTHSLYGLSLAFAKAKNASLGDAEPWQSALARLNASIDRAKSLQNSDGSFPGSLAGMEADSNESNSLSGRILGTGHTLEWLILTLPTAELQKPWILKAVRFLSHAVELVYHEPPAASPWFHALHALRMFKTKALTDGK